MLNNKSGEAALVIVAIVFFVVTLLILTLLGVPLATSAVVLIGSLVFIISFVNTDLALIILIFTMLLSPEFQAGKVSDRAVKLRADDIFIIVIFLGWIAKMAIHKELGIARATRLNRPIMIYIVICLVASFMAVIGNKVNVRTSIFYVMKYIEYFLLFFMVSSNLKTVAQAKKYIFFLLVTCFIVCLYALIGGSTGGRVSAPFESGGGGEPNTLAGYLVVMMTLTLGFIFNSRAGTRKIALIVLLAVSSLALLYSLSRSGWASFFVAITAFTIFNKKNRMLLVSALAVIIMVMPMVAPKEVHQRVKDTFTAYKTYKFMGSTIGLDESGSARIESWQVGLNRWVKRPILGYGIPSGAFIDNQYTRTLNETGILGFAAFITILVVIFKIAHNIYKTMPDDDFAQAVSVGFLSGFAGILLFSSTAAAFTIIRVMEPFWFLAAIIAVLPELEKDSPEAEII